MLNLPSVAFRVTAVTVLLATAAPADAQEVSERLRQMQRAIENLQAELAQARRQSDELRGELRVLREELATLRTEDQELLAAKVDELEQTKVESGSKYHVRLSGLALLQAALTDGEVDSVDAPGVARAQIRGEAGGSVTGGARQSYLRFEVFGPRVGGARVNGETTLDFFGGFPITPEGLTTGLARLRTLNASLNWDHARLSAGHDTPFFSPGSPTSVLSSAYPAMWAAGNMWSWVPQVHAERTLPIPNVGAVLLQAGVLDPLTGEIPASEYERAPTSGERSRTPAVAGRVAWRYGRNDAVRTVGGGAYYSRQAWGFDRSVNAWAITADWDVPLGGWLSTSGEAYRGRAIAGLGASASPSVGFTGPRHDAMSAVLPFESTGGWAQIKLAPASTLEFNAAVGTDRSAPSDAATLLAGGILDRATVRRNTNGLVNVIFTVRSNLLFSIEYRRLFTSTLGGTTFKAGHLGVGGGVGF
jgi:hypothetical protein